MTHLNERQKHTETPRTDAACQQALINNPNRLTFAGPIERMNGWQCMASSLECFARQLEMELNDISTELRQAHAEVERLKRDGERLDWLLGTPTQQNDIMWIERDSDLHHVYCRDAIDSAMAEGGQE